MLLFHEVVKLDGKQHDDVNSVLAQDGCDTIADTAELSEKVADRVIIEGERLLLKNVLEGYFIVKGGLLFLLICHFVALYSIKHWVKDEDVLLVIFKQNRDTENCKVWLGVLHVFKKIFLGSGLKDDILDIFLSDDLLFWLIENDGLRIGPKDLIFVSCGEKIHGSCFLLGFNLTHIKNMLLNLQKFKLLIKSDSKVLFVKVSSIDKKLILDVFQINLRSLDDIAAEVEMNSNKLFLVLRI